MLIGIALCHKYRILTSKSDTLWDMCTRSIVINYKQKYEILTAFCSEATVLHLVGGVLPLGLGLHKKMDLD